MDPVIKWDVGLHCLKYKVPGLFLQGVEATIYGSVHEGYAPQPARRSRMAPIGLH